MTAFFAKLDIKFYDDEPMTEVVFDYQTGSNQGYISGETATSDVSRITGHNFKKNLEFCEAIKVRKIKLEAGTYPIRICHMGIFGELVTASTEAAIDPTGGGADVCP